MGALVLLFAISACARAYELDPHHDAGVAPPVVDFRCAGRTLPSELVDSAFIIVPFECRESTRAEISGLALGIGPEGEAYLGIPDGPEARGAINCEADVWTFRGAMSGGDRRPVAFALRPSREPRVAFVLESVDPADRWSAWALRYGGAEPRETVALPELAAACATREVWEIRAEDGHLLDSGERVPERSATVLRLGFWSSPNAVALSDSSLTRSFVGYATSWNGREGVARSSSGATICELATDEVRFARDGAHWTAGVSWKVPDADDLDGDGDREDPIVRVSRYELRADACR